MSLVTNQDFESQSCGRVLIPLLPIHLEFLKRLLELDLFRVDEFISKKCSQFEGLQKRHKILIQKRFNADTLNAAFAEERQAWENVRLAYLQILKILKAGLEEARYVA